MAGIADGLMVTILVSEFFSLFSGDVTTVDILGIKFNALVLRLKTDGVSVVRLEVEFTSSPKLIIWSITDGTFSEIFSVALGKLPVTVITGTSVLLITMLAMLEVFSLTSDDDDDGLAETTEKLSVTFSSFGAVVVDVPLVMVLRFNSFCTKFAVDDDTGIGGL